MSFILENPFLAILVMVIIVFQIRTALRTRHAISQLNAFFPNIKALKIVDAVLPKNIKLENDVLEDYIKKIEKGETPDMPQALDEDGNPLQGEVEEQQIALIGMTNKEASRHPDFKDMVHRTNIYLCSNVGASADFQILKDICERKIEIMDGLISNSLNTPLFMGLAGTFIGIITGLMGIDLSGITGDGGNVNMNDFQGLISGVVFAMIASLVGLGLTIFNSTILYKEAAKNADTEKDDYYDFLQRKLMPTLSTSMASSLTALKGVLGHFVDKFGSNLDTYTDSIELLNDNIESQKDVLVELNKLSLTKTANQIAASFLSLKEASDQLEVFKSYQKELGKVMQQVGGSVAKIDKVLDRFEDFGRDMSVVVANQSKATELQVQFKNAIEAHFPTGSVGREIWQKQFNELMSDAKEVSETLNSQLKASTEYVKNFVQGNAEFFTTFQQIQGVLGQLAQYAQLQSTCYQDLKEEILQMRRDSKDIQREDAELNRSLLEAVKTMTSALRSLK